MGDRCYMTIQCSKKDYDEVLHEYFVEVLEEDGSYVQAADSEANYAYANEMEEWAKRGIVFVAFHDVGGNYGAYEVACDGQELCEAPYHHDRGLVVKIDETTGKPDADGVEQVRKFLDIRPRVLASLDKLRAVQAEKS